MRTISYIITLALCLGLNLVVPGAVAEVVDNNDLGARLFRKNCVLCHGLFGMGEGLMPMTLRSYPNTSLMDPRFGTDRRSIRDMIAACRSDQPVASECPSFGQELSAKEINALTSFVISLRADPAAGAAKIRQYSSEIKPTLHRGRSMYLARCAACHGASGKGDGRMAEILNPRPYDFTKSTVSDEYIADIVTNGGASLGRSPSMPSFGEDLDDSQLKSVILYLKTLRVSRK